MNSKKENIGIYFIIVILLIFNALSIYHNKKLKQNQNNIMEILEIRTKSYRNMVYEYFNHLETCEIDKIIPADIEIQDKKLILMFNNKMCSSCIINELFNLKELTSEIGINNVLIVSNFDSEKEFISFLKKNNLPEFDVLFLGRDFIFKSDCIDSIQDYLEYYILDSNGFKSFSFTPTSNLPNLTKEYLDYIKNFFETIPPTAGSF